MAFCNICIKGIAAKMVITYRHFRLQQVDKEFNIFICFSVKPSVRVAEQSAGKENKRMFTGVLRETLTGKTQDAQQYLGTSGEGILEQHGHHLQYLHL